MICRSPGEVQQLPRLLDVPPGFAALQCDENQVRSIKVSMEEKVSKGKTSRMTTDNEEEA
jgi:hypothetical protein